MASQQPHDPIGWAKKPRSAKALELLISLVKEKEPVFVGIYEKLVATGKVEGENLIYKWDHVSNSWVKA